MPTLYNLRKGNVPLSARRIDRGTPFGNPFIIGKHGDRETCIRRFVCEVLPTLDVSELRGCDLACWCHPEPCHGTPIMIKANPEYFG